MHQQGLGSMSRGDSNRGNMIKERVFEPHQLSGTVSNFPSIPVLCKTEVRHHHSVKNGQANSGDL